MGGFCPNYCFDSCFDTLTSANLTGTGADESITFVPYDTPVAGLPGSPCPGSAPNLDNLPLTNPGTTYGGGIITQIDPITSPCSHGAVDMPPCPSLTYADPNCTRNGIGSGAGTAASQFANRPSCTAYQNTGSLLSRWGTALTSLIGGKNITQGVGNAPPANNASIAPTSFGFLIFALIVGFILWKLAFSD